MLQSIQVLVPEPQLLENKLIIDRLSAQYSIEFLIKPHSVSTLIITDGRLGIIDAQWPKVAPVFVDFTSGQATFRRMYGGGRRQLLAKAIGLHQRKTLKVLDATAGLGRDAFVLATLGAQVQMIERHLWVYLLLSDGLMRLSDSHDHQLQEIASRLSLIFQDFTENSAGISQDSIDVVYLDPMFPERTKSAKVKKEMALFHATVGHDSDADMLLPNAMSTALCRVVVKRPKISPYLNNLSPSYSLKGKANRYDIYTQNSILAVR